MENANVKKVHCVNCGECGHVIKNCKGPITSFGVIIFKVVYSERDEQNDIPNGLVFEQKDVYVCPFKRTYPKIKFLMIQRKDTMSYIDFLRGKYPDDEPEKSKMLSVQFSEMTETERQSLVDSTFDELWENLWINKSSRLYKNEKFLSKEKFQKVDVDYFLNNTISPWRLQEFGFPKGRRNIRETNIACAEREFYEETGYQKNMYDFIKNYPIIEEEFIGTNNITYKHKYYLLKLKPEYVDFIPELSQTQECEVKSIGWYTIDECKSLIRYYDVQKKYIIQNVYDNICKMNHQFDLSEFYYNRKKRIDSVNVNL